MSISEFIFLINHFNLDPITKSLVTDIFLSNLSPELENDVRAARHHITENSRKHNYKCNHCGCNENSCYSHEITEQVFLTHLSNNEKKVVVLKFDLRNNPISYAPTLTHTRNAVNFPGYCSNHDNILFKEIEGEFSQINGKFMNLQCLRSTRRNLFDTERTINILSSLIDQIKSVATGDDNTASEVINYLSQKIEINKIKKERVLNLYEKIFTGIESGDLFLSYDSYDQDHKNYCFSSYFDLTTDRDILPFIIFLIRLEHPDFSKFFICYPKEITNIVKEQLNLSNPNTMILLTNLMHANKEQFAFSENFFRTTNKTEIDILLSDSSVHELDAIRTLLLSNVLFSPLQNNT